MPRTKIPRPEALSEIIGAFDALLRNECYELCAPDVAERISEVIASRQGAIDRLQALAPKLDPESEEATLIAPVLVFEDAELARYADMPLYDALAAAVLPCEPTDAAERRRSEHSTWEGLGRLKEKARNAKRRSDSVREGAVERGALNRKLIAALAEISLPPGVGRRAKALRHLKDNHPDLWDAKALGSDVPVYQRAESPWFKGLMAESQEIRADAQGSQAPTPKPRRPAR